MLNCAVFKINCHAPVVALKLEPVVKLMMHPGHREYSLATGSTQERGSISALSLRCDKIMLYNYLKSIEYKIL